jgi:hypothetical protein
MEAQKPAEEGMAPLRRYILRWKGPVTGPNPRSYRAEARAMAAVILCMVILHKVVPHHEASYQALAIFSDNQGLVDKITEMMEWETFYPSTALLSEWDILSVIMEFIPQLPLPPAVQHVKGHQDQGPPVASLSLQAQLNCEADALATFKVSNVFFRERTVNGKRCFWRLFLHYPY